MLRYVAQARDQGLGVIFITHNPHHAYPVGDRFVILNRGRMLGSFAKNEITREELIRQMAGGAELEQLTHELQSLNAEAPLAAPFPGSAGSPAEPSAPPSGRSRRVARRHLTSPAPP